ncbi:MAG TPA: SAM-dependent methyltransferase [Myxococcales bacterium]|mgnify:CR=1 FL=1|nr:SAM-dependent methyltransferase [Myxococcales bacterium]HAN31057.1 SAM-dependent methyltransferase [Myxococcales bacterium]
MSLTEKVHESVVFDRRIRVLSEYLASVLPQDAKVLDVGCGTGQMAQAFSAIRPDLRFKGIDILVRPETYMEVVEFDGVTIPFEDDSFDAIMMVDVLHHTADPTVLLREANRVARESIVLKDQLLNGWFSGPTLAFMDKVGNARHGVVLPYNYWRHDQWVEALEVLHLKVESWQERLGLYWWPASLLFDRRLHFVARLSTRS